MSSIADRRSVPSSHAKDTAPTPGSLVGPAIECGAVLRAFDPGAADGVGPAPNADASGPIDLSHRIGVDGAAPARLRPGPSGLWRTHNFEVEEFHTYVAGGVRVHNKSGDYYLIDGDWHYDDHTTPEVELVNVSRFNRIHFDDKPNPPGTIKTPNGGGFEWIYDPNQEDHLKGKRWQSGGDADGDGDLDRTDRVVNGIDLHERHAAVARTNGDDAGARAHQRKADRLKASKGDHDNQGQDRGKPLIVDLDGDGVEITVDGGVSFDMDADGFREQTSWAAADDGFLVIDLDAAGQLGPGDGVIDQAKELILTEWYDDPAATDLEALATFDRWARRGGNDDGKLTAADGIWTSLRVWQDRNQNGVTDGGELRTLAELGVTRIDLAYDDDTSFEDVANDITMFGNTLLGSTSWTRNGERVKGAVGDVALSWASKGYRESTSGGVATVQLEGGESWRTARLSKRASADADLKRENLDGAEGDGRANVLDAGDHHRVVTITGGSGNDTITGGTRADLLSGDAGADVLRGGRGNDVVFFDAADTVVNGGYGWDTAVATGSGGVTLDLDAMSFEVAYGGAGDDRLVAVGSVEDHALHGGAGDDELRGGLGGDRLAGDAGADRLEGNAGDDFALGGAGADVLLGGSDDDRLVAGTGDDALHGGKGDDWLLGGEGRDALHGDEGDDHLEGEDGDDELDGGLGDDVLVGGAGDDVLRWSRGDDHLHGGSGNDRFVISNKPRGVDAVPSNGFWGYAVFQGGRGEDVLELFGFEHNWSRVDVQDDAQGVAQWRFEYYHPQAHGKITLDVQDIETVVFQHGGNPRTRPLEWNNSGRDNSDSYYRPKHLNGLGVGDDHVPELIGRRGGGVLKAFEPGRSDAPDYETWMGDDVFVDGRRGTAITLGTGDDAARGGGGDDELRGDGGDDLLLGDGGDDMLSGHAGTDRIAGGAGNDRIFGGSGADFLEGGAGDDFIMGHAGSDQMVGGAGSDELDGGDGFDRLYGEAGADVLRGGMSADELSGGEDDDALHGDEGHDRLHGGAGADVLHGGHGMDALYGGAGDDALHGGAHDDMLDGGDGEDRLEGGNGDDVIRGGTGVDLVEAGDGNDVVFYRTGDRYWHDAQKNNPRDVGGPGYDTLVVEDGFSFWTNNLGKYGFEVFQGAERADRVIGERDDVDYELLGGAGDDDLQGAGGADVLRGEAGHDTLRGWGGDDVVVIDDEDRLRWNDGSAVIMGGSGRDTLVVEVGSSFTEGNLAPFGFEVFRGADGNDKAYGGHDGVAYELEGGLGDDDLRGAGGDDILRGGAGDDVLRGRGGADRFFGGAGDDTIHWNGEGLWHDNPAMRDVGGTGRDTLVVRAGHAFSTSNLDAYNLEVFLGADGDDDVTAMDGGVDHHLDGGAGDDYLKGAGGSDDIRGGEGDDVLRGGHGRDTLRGEAGDDTVYLGGADKLRWDSDGALIDLGGSGYDLLVVEEGSRFETNNLGKYGFEAFQGAERADRVIGERHEVDYELSGGGGDDELRGAGGADVLRGEAGADLLRGWSGGDELRGGAGSDELHGGLGDDVLDGGEGDDRLYGGEGDDVLRGGHGRDTLRGEAGDDTVYLGGADKLHWDANGKRIDLGGSGYDLLVVEDGAVFRSEHLADHGFEAFRGAARDDLAWGGRDDVAYRLEGRGGRDNLQGAGGADALDGGSGNDVLYGRGGDDTLTGGMGADRLHGGGGTDTASYRGASARVVVDLRDMDNAGEASGDRYEGIENVAGSEHADRLFGDDGANRLFGAGGDDQLHGRKGDDVLKGGAGSDLFVMGRGGGRDRVVDFEDGVDMIRLGEGLDLADADAALARARQVGSDVVFDFGGGDELTVQNTTKAALRDDLDVVPGDTPTPPPDEPTETTEPGEPQDDGPADPGSGDPADGSSSPPSDGVGDPPPDEPQDPASGGIDTPPPAGPERVIVQAAGHTRSRDAEAHQHFVMGGVDTSVWSDGGSDLFEIADTAPKHRINDFDGDDVLDVSALVEPGAAADPHAHVRLVARSWNGEQHAELQVNRDGAGDDWQTAAFLLNLGPRFPDGLTLDGLIADGALLLDDDAVSQTPPTELQDPPSGGTDAPSTGGPDRIFVQAGGYTAPRDAEAHQRFVMGSVVADVESKGGSDLFEIGAFGSTGRHKIRDFDGDDVLDLSALLPSGAMADLHGHVRLAPLSWSNGAHMDLQVDRGGGGDAWQTLVHLSDVGTAFPDGLTIEAMVADGALVVADGASPGSSPGGIDTPPPAGPERVIVQAAGHTRSRDAEAHQHFVMGGVDTSVWSDGGSDLFEIADTAPKHRINDFDGDDVLDVSALVEPGAAADPHAHVRLVARSWNGEQHAELQVNRDGAGDDWQTAAFLLNLGPRFPDGLTLDGLIADGALLL